MAEYRVVRDDRIGRWSLTIRAGDPDELVAVVVNGDQDLAERICALLNADGTEPFGAKRDWVADNSPQLAEWIRGLPNAEPIEHEITTPGEPHRTFLGPDGATRTEPYGETCDCGHEGIDEMFHLTPCPIAMRRLAKRRRTRDNELEAP